MATTYDILLEVTPVVGSNPPAGLFNFTFGNVQGTTTQKSALTTGFYKTLLKWTKCLLTQSGTDLSDPNYGSQFPALFSSNITNSTDLADFLTTCVSQTTATIIGYQTGVVTDPNEALGGANITSLVLNTDNSGFDVYIKLVSVSGQIMVLGLPMDFLPPTTLNELPPGIEIT
jgi:hypothetical protein